MSRLTRRSAFFAGALFLAFMGGACRSTDTNNKNGPDGAADGGGTEAGAAGDTTADFRAKAPPPGPPVTFTPPKIDEARLPNGIRILHVERHELPIVAFQIVVDRGADQGSPGVASFTATMILQGTKTRSAIAISDDLGRLGASYSAGADYDSFGAGARCLTQKLPEVLAIMADVMQNPAFDDAELKREKSKRLTSIIQQNDRPAVLLSNAIAAAIYMAGHPYSSPLLGLEQDVSKITAKDLASYHAANVKPDRITVAIAGDLTKERAVEEITRALGAWQGWDPLESTCRHASLSIL